MLNAVNFQANPVNASRVSKTVEGRYEEFAQACKKGINISNTKAADVADEYLKAYAENAHRPIPDVNSPKNNVIYARPDGQKIDVIV